MRTSVRYAFLLLGDLIEVLDNVTILRGSPESLKSSRMGLEIMHIDRCMVERKSMLNSLRTKLVYLRFQNLNRDIFFDLLKYIL